MTGSAGKRMGSSGGAGSGSGLPPGTLIGERYEVRRLLGRGGQGDVYLVFDRNFGIELALKVLHADFRTDEFLERFRGDAQSLVLLNHPNVVRLYNFDPGYPYMVMEYCGDGDLDRYIKSRKRRTLKEMLHIGAQVCDALAEAHDHKILHRDIKPANVLFKGSTPKLTDFGLAKILREGGGLTTTRGMMGTVRYCSPEQMRDASKVDHHSDLWSMGVLLYELLTWSRPFDRHGDDQFLIMRNIDQEPPREPPYALPAPVMSVVKRALEKSITRRFNSAREMGQAVRAAIDAVPDADRLLLPPENVVDEVSRMASEVADLMSQGHSQEAATVVSRMRKAAPDDSLPRYWNKHLKQITGASATSSPAPVTDWRRRVDSLIEACDFREAKKVVGGRIVEDPDDTQAQDEHRRITEEERRFKQLMERAMAQAEEARQSGDFGRLVEIWHGVRELYPKAPPVHAEVSQAESLFAAEVRRRKSEEALVAARGRQDAGDLAGAVSILKDALAEDPGSGTLQVALRELQQEAKRRERAGRVASLSETVSRARGTGDLALALTAVENFLRQEPGTEEVARLRDEIHREMEEAERATAVAALDLRIDQVQAMQASGRFRGVAGAQALLTQQLEKGRAARTGRRESVETAAVALGAARAEAERQLAAELATRRTRLLETLGGAREWIASLSRQDAPASSTAAGGLADACSSAVAVLASTGVVGATGDPLALLWKSETDLTTAAKAVHNEQRAVTEGLRQRASEAVREAEVHLKTAAESLRVDEASEARARELGDRWEKLRAVLDAGSPRQLEAAVSESRDLGGHAQAARLIATGRAIRELEEALAGSADLLISGAGESLTTKVVEAVGLLWQETEAPLDIAWAGRLAAALRDESSSRRAALQDRMKAVRQHWEQAFNEWKTLVVKDLGTGTREAGQRASEAGQAALESLDADSLDQWSAVLESLLKRYRLESVWIEQSETVYGVEGRQGSGGTTSGEATDAESREVLKRYRLAVACADVKEMRALGSQLAAAQRPARGTEVGHEMKEPAPLGAAVRRLNERLLPDLVRAYDDEMKHFQQAVASHRRGEAQRAAGEIEALQRRIIQPIPMWRQPPVIAAGVLLAAGALVATAFLRPASAHSIHVMSPGAVVQVKAVLHDGTPVPVSPMQVTDAGVTWTDLKPGEYVVRIEGNRNEKRFRVPHETVVFLPGGPANYSQVLEEELGLKGNPTPGDEVVPEGDV